MKPFSFHNRHNHYSERRSHNTSNMPPHDPYYNHDGVTSGYPRNADYTNTDSTPRQSHRNNGALANEPHHHHPYEYSNDFSNSSIHALDPFPLPSSHYHGKIDSSLNLNNSMSTTKVEDFEEAPITVHENDVLMGRGGRNNQHSGNEKLRQLARGECVQYRTSSKKGKSAISRSLVSQMRNMQPPARFLKRNNDGGWEDVGDDIAREKASQVLRDACALLQDDEVPPPSTPSPAAGTSDDVREPGLVRSTDHHRKADSDSHFSLVASSVPGEAPSVENSASFPPPTPVENSRKRHRSYYSSEDTPLVLEPGQEPGFLGSPTRRLRRSSDADRSSRIAETSAAAANAHGRRHSNPYSSNANTNVASYRSNIAPAYGAHPREYSSVVPQQPGFHRRAPSQDGRTPPPQLSRQSSYGQHWRARPSMAARQASAASCSSSLLGELSGQNDFDLFDGGLLDLSNETASHTKQGNSSSNNHSGNDKLVSKTTGTKAPSAAAPPPQAPSS